MAENPYMTILQDVEEQHAPPSQPVLLVEVVEEDAFLTLARADEDGKSRNFTKIEQVTVPVAALVEALGFEVESDEEDW